jgi:hypothetical protein
MPKLAERAIETSATRARVRIDLAIVGVAGSIVGRAPGWHRRVATLLIRSRRQAWAGEHPLLQRRHLQHSGTVSLNGAAFDYIL